MTKEAFQARLCKSPTGCLEWMGMRAATRGGYGQLIYEGRTVWAHRLSYALHFGPYDQRMMVLHKCDNPPCCNPEHLFLGDGKMNMQDAKRKGRIARGEYHPGSKMTEKDVIRILKSSETVAELARELNVSRSTVSLTRSGVRWKHVYDRVQAEKANG